jgi:hypothetical protein
MMTKLACAAMLTLAATAAAHAVGVHPAPLPALGCTPFGLAAAAGYLARKKARKVR